MIFILVSGLFLAFFIHRNFLKKKYKQNRAHFQRRRDKFEGLLQTIRTNRESAAAQDSKGK